MSRARALWMTGLSLVACRESRSTGPTPIESVQVPVDPATAAQAQDSGAADATDAAAGPGGSAPVRVRGDIRARVTTDKPRYALGEPMLVELEATRTGSEPIVFDDRPSRYTWIIRDESRTERCKRAGPDGRLGSWHVKRTKLELEQTFRETLLLNPLCAWFVEPGRYRVSVTRLLGDDPAASPSIEAEVAVEVLPWDAGVLRARLAGWKEERAAAWRARELSREGALTEYADWFCGHVRCDCPPSWKRDGDWFPAVAAVIPDTVPAGCGPR